MPIYEYRCTKCGNELEVMQKISEPAPAVCPKCAAEHSLERLVSRSSFQLKGGGWYSDLYGSVKKETAATAAPSTGTSTATAPAAPAAAAASSTPASSGSGGSSSGGSSSGGSSSSGSSGGSGGSSSS
jgi:putative FmdB family regulatory protein